MTTNAQEKVESMFHKSIKDAKKAFKISLGMNIIVFLVGIVLITVSGIMAISNDDQDNWAGVGVTSGTGFLSVMYSLFINKPSRKIRKNTNHLMRLKVIFLGCLRELTQMEQSFSKTLIIPPNTGAKEYVSKIKCAMNNASEALRWEELLNNTQDKEGKNKLINDVVESQMESDKYSCTKNQANSNLLAIYKIIDGKSNIIILDKENVEINLKQIEEYLKSLQKLDCRSESTVNKLSTQTKNMRMTILV